MMARENQEEEEETTRETEKSFWQVLNECSGNLKIDDEHYKAELKKIRRIRTINEGAHGTVSLCHFECMNRMKHRMAVKSMNVHKVDELKTAKNDSETMSRLSHDNIVQYYGLFVTEVSIEICMEFMAGCFDQFLKRTKQPIPEDIIGKMSVSVVNALDYLKTNNNMMHRDIKPSNILISWDGVVKLCDFSIARELVLSRAFTRTAGCVLYWAPERFGKESYDIRSDVWSFGITLVELATGRYPYYGNELSVEDAIQKKGPPRLEENCFSRDLCNLVKRCLQKDPEDRSKFCDLLTTDPFIQQHSADTNANAWLCSVLAE